jgi:hypothetical protein
MHIDLAAIARRIAPELMINAARLDTADVIDLNDVPECSGLSTAQRAAVAHLVHEYASTAELTVTPPAQPASPLRLLTDVVRAHRRECRSYCTQLVPCPRAAELLRVYEAAAVSQMVTALVLARVVDTVTPVPNETIVHFVARGVHGGVWHIPETPQFAVGLTLHHTTEPPQIGGDLRRVCTEDQITQTVTDLLAMARLEATTT